MALMKCPECLHEVSDRAVSCPNCAFPIAEYLQEEQFKAEVAKLQGQIKPITFTTPAPHLKLCIKCGAYWSGTSDTPTCQCSLGGHHFPGIEIDYPAKDSGYYPALLYIQNHYIEDLNIGDKDSAEYQERLESLYNGVRDCENYKKSIGVTDYKMQEQTPEESVKKWHLDTDPEAGYAKKTAPTYHTPAPTPNVPKCPICGSTDLSKITTAQKTKKALLWGLFAASDMGKTWKCNHCGSKF